MTFLIILAVVVLLAVFLWPRPRNYVPKKLETAKKCKPAEQPATYHAPESRMQSRIRHDTERDLSEWHQGMRNRR